MYICGLMNLAQQIKDIRTLAGLEQKELAAGIGVTPSYISLIETGKRLPSIPVLQLISTVTGRTIVLNIEPEK